MDKATNKEVSMVNLGLQRLIWSINVLLLPRMKPLSDPKGEVSHLLMLQRVNILNKTTALEGVFGLEMMRIADGKGENSPKAERAVIGFTCVCHVVLLG